MCDWLDLLGGGGGELNLPSSWKRLNQNILKKHQLHRNLWPIIHANQSPPTKKNCRKHVEAPKAWYHGWSTNPPPNEPPIGFLKKALLNPYFWRRGCVRGVDWLAMISGHSWPDSNPKRCWAVGWKELTNTAACVKFNTIGNKHEILYCIYSWSLTQQTCVYKCKHSMYVYMYMNKLMYIIYIYI